MAKKLLIKNRFHSLFEEGKEEIKKTSSGKYILDVFIDAYEDRKKAKKLKLDHQLKVVNLRNGIGDDQYNIILKDLKTDINYSLSIFDTGESFRFFDKYIYEIEKIV